MKDFTARVLCRETDADFALVMLDARAYTPGESGGYVFGNWPHDPPDPDKPDVVDLYVHTARSDPFVLVRQASKQKKPMLIQRIDSNGVGRMSVTLNGQIREIESDRNFQFRPVIPININTGEPEHHDREWARGFVATLRLLIREEFGFVHLDNGVLWL
jgi:hypothetical protein